ncbi:peptidoglycan peptidase [Bdellovibrio sp. qaytius]|nr:peptidoglycan peptidase [Bdellovibrio sp. qaytius]
MKTSGTLLLIILSTLIMALSACHTQSGSSNLVRGNDIVIEPKEVTEPVTEPTLKTGDIIFQKSQSKQANAIHEASESEWSHVGILVSKNDEWYVAEAIGPVVATKLEDFINRGKDKEYKIYRFKYFDSEKMQAALIKAIKKQNKSYDIYFELSDDKTYCSELVYKVMLAVTGHELGHMQQFKDLKLDGPFVKDLIQRRLTDQGRELDTEEPIITPISQMQDPNLTLIKD